MKRSLLLLLVTLSVFAQQPDRESDRGLPRIQFTTALEEVVVVEDGGGIERALAEYQKPGPLDQAKMARIYEAAGQGAKAFKNVAWLIGQEKISAEDSVAMATIREAMIEDLIKSIAKDNGWRIARSDSGNVTSGMKSDLDQTFYVFEVKKKKGKNGYEFKRVPDLDNKFIAEFNQRWESTHGKTGLSLGALDIASIEGRNRFPDVRVETVPGFWAENRRTSEALRNTPGAYTYAGAVGHQMQFRALEAILNENRRAFQTYEPAKPGDPKSEWVSLKGNKDEAIKTMFGKRPELRPVWAFDAALANYLELVHYLDAKKFESKYHLRTWEDSLWSKMLADAGKGREGKFELIDKTLAERNAFNDQALNRLFPGDDAATVRKRKIHRMAIEVSVALRLQHKGPDYYDRIDAFGGNPPESPERQKELIFDELGRELYGDDWGKPELKAQQLADVDKRYRRLAVEFCVDTAYNTSKEAFAVLLDEDGGRHIDPEKYRSLLKVESDAEWEVTKRNLQNAAHLTFLYGIYELGVGKSLELMNRIRADFGNQHVPRLLALWMRGRLQGLEGPIRTQGFTEFVKGYLAEKIPSVAERVQSHVLSELGFENRPIVDKITGEISGVRLDWEFSKVAKNMAYDPGNIDALAQIVRVYFESKGDPDAVSAAIADEFLLAIPVVGQIVGASRGGVAGLALMGAAMAYPPVGGVLIAVSVGQAGLAIYDVEVARPAQANAVAAVYRGFSGPETYYFDSMPLQFTDADQKALDEMVARIRRNKPPPPGFVRFYDEESALKWQEERRRIEAPWRRLKAELEPKIQALRAKKAAWESKRDDPAYGGYFTGASARLAQEPFENYLLAAIEPILSFSPYGLVDFEVRQDEAEVERLRKAMLDAPDHIAGIRAEFAYKAVRDRYDAMLRARRYLARAMGQRGEAPKMSPAEERMGLPELRFKLKRDSLYPALQRLGYSGPDAFVDAWFAGNKAVLAELVARKFCRPDSGPTVWVPAYPEPQIEFTELSAFPSSYLEELKLRVRQDYARSKLLWEKLQERKQARELKAKQDLERRIQCFEAAAAGEAVSQMLRQKRTESLSQLYDAMREGVSRPRAPEIQTTVYRRPQPRTEGATARVLGEPGYAVDFNLRVDPLHFGPPYSSELRALDAAGARQAISSGKAGGAPLFPSTVDALRRALAKNPPRRGAKDNRDFFLVSVLSGTANEDLGAPRYGKRFLIGQSVHTGASERKPEKKPPAKVEDVWVLTHQASTKKEWVAAYEKVRSRFPVALRNWKAPTKKQNSHGITRMPTGLRPVPTRLDLSNIAKHLEYQKRRGEDPLKFVPIRDRRYQLSRHSKITCNGVTLYSYTMRVGPYIEATGSSSFAGLSNGTHQVRAVVMTEEGDRVANDYTVRVKLKPLSQQRMKSWEGAKRSLTRAREKLREFNGIPVTRRRVVEALIKLAQIEISRGASLGELEKVILEACDQVVKMRPTGNPRSDVRPANRMHLVHKIARYLVTPVPTQRTVAALEAAFKSVGPLPADTKKNPAADVHYYLSNLVIAVRNDLEGGLNHRKRCYAIKKRERPDYKAKDISWWPKNAQFK